MDDQQYQSIIARLYDEAMDYEVGSERYLKASEELRKFETLYQNYQTNVREDWRANIEQERLDMEKESEKAKGKAGIIEGYSRIASSALNVLMYFGTYVIMSAVIDSSPITFSMLKSAFTKNQPRV